MNRDFPKQLRRNSTDAERKLWQHLRNRLLEGHKFRRQHPIPPFVVDFVCLEKRLIVELDGGQHISQIEHDAKRTEFLQSKGFRVLRFWNDDALLRTESVLAEILEVLTAPHPNLLPARGEKE